MEEIIPTPQTDQGPPAADSQNQTPVPQSKKYNKKFMVAFAVLTSLILGGGGYYLSTQNNNSQVAPVKKTVSISPIASPAEPKSTLTLTEIQSVDKLNPSAVIKIAFVRDRNIYLYEDGKEKVVAKPKGNSTQKACNNLVLPFLSPNGKYLAYIEQIGDVPEYGGCREGILRVVNIASGVNKSTNHKISIFHWTPSSNILFTSERELHQSPQQYTVKNINFSPITGKEIVFETVIDQDKSTWADNMLSGEFPADDANKLIRYKEEKYYLFDKQTNKEAFLLDKSQATSFLDWSPSGRYAVFESTKKSGDDYEIIELVVDTLNLTATPKEITVGRGASGGDFGSGRKWYFEKGFVAYCRQFLYFVDGSDSLELTNNGGGGCHNEDGFVATSPNGEFAFVKFSDRFELHALDGSKKVITETSPLAKSRIAPKNLIWINDDNMAIFEKTDNSDYGTGEKPKVYLFDRKANAIKPLIQNAYLITSL